MTHIAETARQHPGIRRSVLPSGLRVVTENVASARGFSIGCFIAAGSRHETARVHGVSHFLEHVLFKGTRRRSAEEISTAIETVGGDINAFTTREYTCFHARVLAEDADLATDILLDMLTASTISGADVEAEREVILDEIDMHADEPSDVAWDLTMASNFPDGSLGRSVIGTAESIRSLDRRNIRDFWRRQYRPDRVVVTAAGAVDHDRLVAALQAWQVPAVEHRSRPLRRERPRSGEMIRIQRDLEQAHVVMSFPGLGINDAQVPALGALTTALGGGMASRLFVEVRERRGLAYSIDAGDLSFDDTGVWSVEWTCSPRRLPQVFLLVSQICREVARHGITQPELDRAIGQLRGSLLLSAESIDARMMQLGTGELTGDRRTVDELVQAHQAVTLADVHRVAAAATRRPTVVVVGPPDVTKLNLEW